MITDYMALPLFLVFYFADLIYAYDHRWLFLFLRCLIIPMHIMIHKVLKKLEDFSQAEFIALALVTLYASIVNCMIYNINDYSSLYYAGLNLIAIGALTFIPWRMSFFAMAITVIYTPYILSPLFIETLSVKNYGLNVFFIASTAFITLIIRVFHENLQIKAFNSHFLLTEELDNRESIIAQKTTEGLRLAKLSSQFSPQVIDAIKTGKRSLSENHLVRSDICTIFIDAVSSTERITSIEHEKFIVVIQEFMEITINSLLKYDLTIDKFYGDGVLAFSNEPIKREDYIKRTCIAALEIKKTINEKKNDFLINWGRSFDITIGISHGPASVGFFGNKSFIKQYSAIGECMAKAQRLSSLCEPNQLLVDNYVAEIIKNEGFELECLGEKKLKGFEKSRDIVYNLLESDLSFDSSETCYACKKNSVYLEEVNGIYVLKCRNCLEQQVIPAAA